MQVIPPPIKKILDKWNIRGLVIMSLLFQTSLIFLAPLRKRSSKKWLAAVLWTAYLLADWTANYAVSQITKNQGKEPKPDDPPKNKKLLALWAPFLLLHLGGPDTITALALEDNALWQRHLFGLVSQALAGVYAVVQSMENVLWPPITLLFITGTIKYVERTRALYSASLDKFKDRMLKPADTGPNYARLMEEYASRKESNLPTNISLTDEPDKHERPPTLVRPDDSKYLTDLEIVQYGFKFFNTFKGLVVDLIFSFRERDESRDFFKKLYPEEALRIIETELGFLYESMYTKTAILHTKTGTLFRLIAFGSLLSSFFVFHRRPGKYEDFHGADVVITYILFIVGIALDLASVVIFLLSDWTFAVLSKLKDDPEEEKSSIDPLLNWFLGFRKPRWKKYECNRNQTHEVLATWFFSRRWSGTIYGFNFIGYCLKAKVSRIHQKSNLVWDSVVLIVDRVIRSIQMFLGWIKDVNGSFRSVMRQWSKKNLMFRYTVYPLYLLFFSGIPEVFKVLWGYIERIFSVKSYLNEIRFIEPLTKIVGRVIRSIQMLLGWIKDVNGSFRSVMRQWSKKNPMFCYTVYQLYLLFFAGIPKVFGVLWGYIERIFSVKSYLDKIRFISREPLTKNQWEIIFHELKDKSDFAEKPEDAKKLSWARGEWALRDAKLEKVDTLMLYIENVDYDQSLLLWHIATELCFQEEEGEEIKNLSRESYDDREFSKIISDYMTYLLIMRPKLMSEVAGIGTIRFRDTKAEADRFFKGRNIKDSRDMKGASKMVLSVSSKIDPMLVKGDRSKSVLFDASMLAKELRNLKESTSYRDGKWRVLRKVWVELLCYAASHCKAKEHVAQLSRGGELLNFVWLLMAHFGLADQFQINKGDARAKLVVGK